MNSVPLVLITWMAVFSAAWHGFKPSLLTELFLWSALCVITIENWRKDDR